VVCSEPSDYELIAPRVYLFVVNCLQGFIAMIKFNYCFIRTAGVILFVTAVAKLFSATGSARILQLHDPVFLLPFRLLFWLVGILELGIALACFFSQNIRFPALLLAWLSTCFLTYRIAVKAVGYHGACPCLGSLTDALHISPHLGDSLMFGVFVYLIIGSYSMLFRLWRVQRELL